jgi:YbbR domain-containing protein
MNIISQVVAPVDVTGLESDTTVAGILKVYDKNGDPFTETQLSSLEFKDEQGSILANHTVSVRVNLWRIRTSVPIIVQTTGSPAWGYEVTDIVTIPETISLAGTEEALQQLGTGLVVSDQIDVTGASSSVMQELDLTATLSEMEGLKLLSDTDPAVQVEVVIGASGDITISVPLSDITFLNKPSGMDLVFTPADEVQVKLHALSEDAAQPAASDLKLSVDLAECAREGSHELPVTVTAPEGYEPASDLTITVVSAQQEEQTEGR